MAFKKSLIIISIFATMTLALFTIVPQTLAAADTKIDAVSSPTQSAVKRPLPDRIYLYVGGEIQQPYRYSSAKLEQFPTIRIRDIEVDSKGEILGAYIYTGIPVLYFMEKTTPLKWNKESFSRPLDMKVVLHSSKKEKVYFSYGELTLANDNNPVILAYHREPLEPTKATNNYRKNKLTRDLNGFRLICPGDKDNSRYLDDVRDLSLHMPDYPVELLPKIQKNQDCASSTITIIDKKKAKKARFKDVPRKEISNWSRIGHGRGIKGDKPASASGFHLRSFLKKNFADCSADDFFLFAGCDGYRALLSGKEIFNTDAGNGFIIMDSLNGKKTRGGFTLGTIADFFIDRNVKGLSHILRL
ncbi:MAG: hypothetical protein GY940_02130 [bacterium]|nr:hypothetical protein [bacterium]